jgi:ribosome-associated protein
LTVSTIVAFKGIEPTVLKVTEFCSFADYFIICSGGSKRHVLALAQHIEEALKQVGIKPLGVEGLDEGQWVLLDYNSMVVHIFLQPLRDFYNLENLWSEAPKTQIDADKYPQPASISSQDLFSEKESDSESIHHE